MTTTNKTTSFWKRKLYSSVCTQLIAWTELFFPPFSKSNMQCWRYECKWWHILVENNKSFICILCICVYEIECVHIYINKNMGKFGEYVKNMKMHLTLRLAEWVLFKRNTWMQLYCKHRNVQSYTKFTDQTVVQQQNLYIICKWG